jgi:hypothetical protein
MRHLIVWAALALAVACAGFAVAGSRSAVICWADRPERCPSDWGDNPRRVFYSCGTGGHSGFSPDWICKTTCGQPMGRLCRLKAGPGGSGGACGYRLVEAYCE